MHVTWYGGAFFLVILLFYSPGVERRGEEGEVEGRGKKRKFKGKERQ